LRQIGQDKGRFASVPFWVLGESGRSTPGRRQCTREFKIDAVNRKTRELLGLKKYQRAGKGRVEEWIGISTDEASRMKPSRYAWKVSRWPLIEQRLSRSDCIKYLAKIGWPAVGKSACVFCPYRGELEWDEWRTKHPDQFEQACKWDDIIRDASRRGMKQPQYILKRLKPLRELPPASELESKQINLFNNECEGMCGV
jgi:hypothetical protein